MPIPPPAFLSLPLAATTPSLLAAYAFGDRRPDSPPLCLSALCVRSTVLESAVIATSVGSRAAIRLRPPAGPADVYFALGGTNPPVTSAVQTTAKKLPHRDEIGALGYQRVSGVLSSSRGRCDSTPSRS